MLTRLTPLQDDDTEGFDELKNMLHNIDPCIALTKKNNAEIDNSLEAFKQFYYDTFGKPGTPEFEQRIKEINQKNI